MLSIPLPFIASLFLVVIAIILRVRQPASAANTFWFVLLCALSTAIVGFRWSTDIALFRFLQPISGACIPIAAYLCFSAAHNTSQRLWLHGLSPLIIAFFSFNHEIWLNAVDFLLIALYVGYGAVLIAASFSIPESVRISNIGKVNVAERIAGALLLFSALIDGALSYDFLFNDAAHVRAILSSSYLILIPAIIFTVVLVSASTPANNSDIPTESDRTPTSSSPTKDVDANAIVAKLDVLMREKQAFLDPDLTLERLARKLGIPARHISASVNQVLGENISKAINRYRIDYAKELLAETSDSISDIYLQSGFQTKSNFNREFSRITGQTPSAFRLTASDR
ncbi:helix-turn-helix domain-containing protein [Enterovibrio coralii]|uniref:AraC family transcriptional regulator n=1 Tax=Enterovibrio coralii TaxID=294935 RepID=A0A135ID73_9GAMM|nr:AraC family transcriptional regulator [Enterovibrio coralii]KXF83427.1 AraC family transcriptional regulator [Enterovibrio coralii]